MDQLVIAREFQVRRTELTCPAHSLKMMAKAASSEADEVIFDLEDSCAVSQKIDARRTLVEALSTLDFQGKIRAFRPNNIRTRFFYRDVIDIVEAAGRFIDVLVVPKVHGPEDVLFVDRLLSQIEDNMGFVPGAIKLEVLIESAASLLKAEQIAACTPRMGGLIFGIADYAGDTGAKELKEEQFFYYNYPKSHCIAAARAAGITVIDNVTLQFRDLEQCRKDSEMASRMGFDGKWAVHPEQVKVINKVFTPSTEEIARAQHVLEEYRKADVDHGLGAIVIDDEMVDAATLRVEWKKLAVARRAGLLDPAAEAALV